MPLRTSLTPEELKKVESVRWKAFLLYEGKVTGHRSCGISVAETFSLPTRPYQALRLGGITGEGECGAIKAGELVLGEFLGDPDPTGPLTPILREAAELYRKEWIRRVNREPPSRQSPPAAPGREGVDIICNHLIAPLGDFKGPERKRFCTNVAAQVAEIVAEILMKAEIALEIVPVETPSS